MRCKTLTAIYKNEINTLKKLYEIDFLIHKSVRIHIEQFTVRKIEIDFTSEQLVDDLIAVLTKVERLLMLFDGYFMPLFGAALAVSSATHLRIVAAWFLYFLPVEAI